MHIRPWSFKIRAWPQEQRNRRKQPWKSTFFQFYNDINDIMLHWCKICQGVSFYFSAPVARHVSWMITALCASNTFFEFISLFRGSSPQMCMCILFLSSHWWTLIDFVDKFKIILPFPLEIFTFRFGIHDLLTCLLSTSRSDLPTVKLRC